MPTVEEIRKQRENISVLSRDLTIALTKQANVKERVSALQVQVDAIVGKEDPKVFMDALNEELAELERKITAGVGNARQIIDSIGGTE